MALVLTRQNQPDFESNRITFSKVEKVITARDKTTSDELRFQYPLERDDKFDTNYSQFEVYLFHKDSFAANDIFQIKIQNKRLGWLFPIQALLTAQHDYAADEHFFPYSFNAYKILIKNKNNLPYKSINYDDFSSIEDIYGENTIVFIVYKKHVKEIKKDLSIDFQITNYLLFLYQHGYTYLTSNNFSSLFDIKLPNPPHKSFINKTVELTNLSTDLFDEKLYLNSLVQGLIKLEKHPLIKFHLLYSVIELFISKIFETEFKANLNAFLNTADFHDSKEKLTKLTNEKERLNKLLSNKCPGLTQNFLEDLKNSSNNFLSFVFAPQAFNKEAGEGLYKVRSTIFHNLRLIPNGYEMYLNDVIERLESLIIEMCLRFKL